MKTQKKKLKTKKINKKNSSKQKCQNAYQLKILPLSIYLSRSLCSAEHHICICKTNWWAGAGQNHKRTVRITHWLSLSLTRTHNPSISISLHHFLSIPLCLSLTVCLYLCLSKKKTWWRNECQMFVHWTQGAALTQTQVPGHPHKDSNTGTQKKSNRNCRSCVA